MPAVVLESARSTRRSPSQMGLREAAYAAAERQLSKKVAARQKNRHVALSGIFMLCCAVRQGAGELGRGRGAERLQLRLCVLGNAALPCKISLLLGCRMRMHALKHGAPLS